MQFYDQITEFVFCESVPEKADFIIIPGSGYGELAVKAARLYRDGYAGKVIASGKYTTLAEKFQGPISPEEYVGMSFMTEADFMGRILNDHGVLPEDIILENQATFTYENALYIRKLLTEKYGYDIRNSYRMILVCQAFHARRSLMYFQYVFPNVEFICCPAVTQNISKENWYSTEKGRQTVLGEVTRCGTQFTDMINGKDQVFRKILGHERESFIV